jgi:aspartate/methionine/tyrosine aminotransferase
MQIAALPLVSREVADQEARAIQKSFGEKRQLMLSGLEKLGIIVDPAPLGAFYCWGDLRNLPQGLNTGMEFFRKALDNGVIIVPGEFFDINPGQRRPDRPSRFQSFARFSFGPPREEIVRGLGRLKRLL